MQYAACLPALMPIEYDGKVLKMDYRIVLINGYDETRLLAKSLIHKGYKVTAINECPQNCQKLSTIKGLQVFCGDGSKPFVLEDASVYGADLAIAMSPYYDANLVICQLCKKNYNVKKTVAIITDPSNKKLFKDLGVDSVVCAVSIISGIIQESVALNKDINEITEGLGLDG